VKERNVLIKIGITIKKERREMKKDGKKKTKKWKGKYIEMKRIEVET